jgi:hypothetical protein
MDDPKKKMVSAYMMRMNCVGNRNPGQKIKVVVVAHGKKKDG